jgi:hypothetical protein
LNRYQSQLEESEKALTDMDERLTETTNELYETKEQLNRISQILHEKDIELKKLKNLSFVSDMQKQDSTKILEELQKKNREYETV